jgi:alcohol dehydrogenase, propanol-preferring
MRGLLLDTPRRPLRAGDVRLDPLGANDVLLDVRACGVCRTDLHTVDGDLTPPVLPIVPGHEIVGVVIERGERADRFRFGDRVGVPWLGWTCGECAFCRTSRENLCARARFTGFHRHGGYAERAVADARYCLALPTEYDDAGAAPLLCAGLIGYRALCHAGDGERLGLYGFGAAAHLVAQVAIHQGRRVFAFTRAGDDTGQAFARSLGAVWAGASDTKPPEPLDAAIIFAPVGALVPVALAALERGGRVVCAGIHMSDVPAFPYELLWGERSVASVANLTRRDGETLLSLAPRVPVRAEVEVFPLAQANEALTRLRNGTLRGAAVLQP